MRGEVAATFLQAEGGVHLFRLAMPTHFSESARACNQDQSDQRNTTGNQLPTREVSGGKTLGL